MEVEVSVRERGKPTTSLQEDSVAGVMNYLKG
jgi:hypothetical protein